MNFEEIIQKLNDRDMQKVLREVEKNDLAIALKNTESEVQNKIYRNMSHRATGMLKDTVYYMGPYSKKRVEESKENIMAIIKRLDKAGEIVVERKSSGKLVEEPVNIINRIEDAIRGNGELRLCSWDGIKAADVEPAFSCFENREQDLAHITSLSIPADLFGTMEPLFKIGNIETLEIQCAGSDLIGDNKETILPESIEIKNCVRLKKVSLSSLAKLPEWLRWLPALESLTLSSMKTTLPDWISEIYSLRCLAFEWTQEEESLSNTIVKLSALTELAVRYSNIAFIPKAIGNLTSLVKLTLTGMEITVLPDSIGNLTSLVSFDLSHNEKLVALPESIRNLAALEYFDLSNDKQLASLPDTICNLHSLKTLNLNSTKLLRLPECIGNVTTLKELYVNHTPLVYLPESLGFLKRLESLDITYTPLKILPQSMDKLTSLVTLDISGTEIESFPSSIIPIDYVNHTPLELIKETGTLSYNDFINGYYRTVKCISALNIKAHREGLLAVEEEMDSFKDGYFKAGIRLVVDGVDGDIIRFILSNKADREHDEYRKRLMEIQMEGIIGIQEGWSPATLVMLLNSMVCIPDDPLNKLCIQYLDDYTKALDLDNIDFPMEPEKETEREEVRFIKRAVGLAEYARKEGLLSLEDMLDKAAIANRDILEYGLCFVIDGLGKENIEKILNNLVEHESDSWKKNLQKAKKVAVLSIHAGEVPRMLAEKLFSCFGSDVRTIAEKEVLND